MFFDTWKSKRDLIIKDYQILQLTSQKWFLFSHLSICIDINAFIIITQQKLHAIWIWKWYNTVWWDGSLGLQQEEVYKLVYLILQLSISNEEIRKCISYHADMFWKINIIDRSRIKVDSMETISWSINDLQTSSFFYSEIHKERSMLKVTKWLNHKNNRLLIRSFWKVQAKLSKIRKILIFFLLWMPWTYDKASEPRHKFQYCL